ncbi:MAG: thiamine phosphate synthase [Myxococcota bacterium]|nr:thiamine phosphate synthase [Myxococcota bacterium]
MLVAITDRRMMAPGALTRVRADIIQVREKDLEGGPLLALVREAMATGARVMVNDRADVAVAAGAYGVHLPERGMSVADVRALGVEVIGVSRHSLDGVRRALDEGADIIQLGPIWRTPGKGEPLGPLVLEGARALIGTRAQLVAVGGIETQERVKSALRAGADGVAAIRAVWSGALSETRRP